MIEQSKITQTSLSLFLIIIIILSFSVIIPYNSYIRAAKGGKESPYGKNKWKLSGNIQYISKMNDTDGYEYHDFGTDAKISLKMKNETKKWVDVILKIELKDSMKPVGDLEKNILRFKIRKEDNIAFLDMKNHSNDGYKLGFFPFFGYCENNKYPRKIEYMSRISEKVIFRENYSVTFPEKGDPDACRPIGSSIDYWVKEDPIKIVKYPMWNNSKPFGKNLLCVCYKIYDNKFYLHDSSVVMPSKLFFTTNNYTDDYINIDTDVSIKVPVNPDDIDYKDYEFLKTIEMKNLYPEKKDESDSDLTPIFMLAVPAVIASGAGYLAYKKQED